MWLLVDNEDKNGSTIINLKNIDKVHIHRQSGNSNEIYISFYKYTGNKYVNIIHSVHFQVVRPKDVYKKFSVYNKENRHEVEKYLKKVVVEGSEDNILIYIGRTTLTDTLDNIILYANVKTLSDIKDDWCKYDW